MSISTPGIILSLKPDGSIDFSSKEIAKGYDGRKFGSQNAEIDVQSRIQEN